MGGILTSFKITAHATPIELFKKCTAITLKKWLAEIFYLAVAAQFILKHHGVAGPCEVSPYFEQYSQSLPLYKSETLKEKSLLYVFLLSFQSPHLPKPILLKFSPEFFS